jgi:hypothetical protein
MPKDRDFHLVNISEAQKMTVRELLQRIADHEKAYIDQLKADARKREKERKKQSNKRSKGRTNPKRKNNPRRSQAKKRP